MNGKWKASLVAPALVALSLGAGPAGAAQRILLATSLPGGGTFEIGTAMGKVITDHSGGKFQVEPSVTGGSSANVRVLQKQDADTPYRMAMVTSPAVYWGQNAIQPFKTKQDVLALAALYPLSVVYVSPEEKGIKEWKDLVGKHFVVGGRGGSIFKVTLSALKISGLFDKVEKEYFNNPQNAAALKDKRVDAGYFFLNAYVPAPAYMDLARVREGHLNFFGPDEATLKKLESVEPGVVMDTIPAGSIAGVDKPIVSWTQMWAMVASSKMSDDDAYQMVKLLMENHGDIVKYHPIGKVIGPTTGLKGLKQITLHPGAARYWKEKGMLK
jgi:uncharacterized protein